MSERRGERLAHRILRSAFGDAGEAVYVLADLLEERAAMGRSRKAPLSALWFWQELLRVAVRVRFERGRIRRGAGSGWRGNLRSRGDSMGMELRQALRFLGRRPGFAAAVILTVTLSIAAVTLAYAMVDGVLVEPLAYPSPERLVVVWEHNLPRAQDRNVTSPANYLAWRERSRSFAEAAALVELSGTVLDEGEPERVGAVLATGTIFRVLGATPLHGRLYDESDDAVGAEPVVVLGESYWRRRYGSDPDVIGRTIELNGGQAAVVGVLPDRLDFAPAAAFGGMGSRDVWMPPRWGPEAREAGGRFLQVVARLAPGATVETARRDMSGLASQLRDEYPVRQAGWDVNVLPLREQVVGDVRAMLLIVFGAVCLVLLIACANVANLLVTRAIERHQELVVRAALGAGRGRLTRQLLLESAILSLAGGVLGLLLAHAALGVLVASGPEIPRLDTIAVDPSVVLFALFATVATALLFGLVPALHIVGTDVGSWLRDRDASSRREAHRLRSLLVVGQTALSLMLLIGAGLLVRSLAARLDVGVGFATEQLLTAEVELNGAGYQEGERRSAFFEELVDRARGLPGVAQVSAITFPPLGGAGSATSFWPADRPAPPEADLPVADIRWVHRDYHATLGIPLLAGRLFDETDNAAAPLHVVINRTAAESLWPDRDAVGERIVMPWEDTLRAEVIGVVADIRHDGPETELRPMFYWDHRQFQDFRQMTLVLRTAADPAATLPRLRALLREMDPTLPLYNARTMDEMFDNSVARARLATVSMTVFALLALLLAGIGIYGVVAHVTKQREREIGIRMALGADRGGVLRLIIGEGMRLVAVALVLGSLGALALTRLLRGLVFQVTTTDPVTFIVMIGVLGAAGLAACLVPARRAATIPPVDAMKVE